VNQDIPQLLAEENSIAKTDFTEQELHDIIMQMEKNKDRDQTCFG
jgi:hypothetical protein